MDTTGAALQSTPSSAASEDGQNPQAKQALRVAQTTVDSLKVSFDKKDCYKETFL